MNVTLIGSTQFYMPVRLDQTELYRRVQTLGPPEDADLLAEFAGRLCYDSFDLPNDKTATNEGYLENIARQRHFSVMEHASATFLVEGVSRSLLMEFRTHRHASFSARSTRYVDESESDYVVPPALTDHLDAITENETGTLGANLNYFMDHAQVLYEEIFNYLVDTGCTRKQAREAAREVLPGMTQTEFVVTANHHSWRDILSKRLAPGAAREIRDLSREILRNLKEIAPSIYQDMPEGD